MSLVVGLESILSFPNEKQKNSYEENLENIFVLREHNKIVAVCILDDNGIDSIAVAMGKQCKGYGKKSVSYSVNKLLDRGYQKVSLWVVEGN